MIAANVRPVRLEHGALLVEVDEPAWATQVRSSPTTSAAPAWIGASRGVTRAARVERRARAVAGRRRRRRPLGLTHVPSSASGGEVAVAAGL